MSDPSSPPSGGSLPPNPRDARRPAVPLRSTFSPLTVTIISLAVAAGVFTRLGADSQADAWLEMSKVQFSPSLPNTFLPEVWHHGQLWRLLTPVFLHFGPLHLIFNLYWLRDFGGLLERRYGTARFALLFLAVALGSNLIQYAQAGPLFGGLSGVVYGLFGYVLVQNRLNPAGFGYVLNPQTVYLMLGWLVLCMTGLVGSIANGAHVAGLLIGAAISWVVAARSHANLWRRQREFRQAAATDQDEPLHRCKTCGRTERTAPQLDFRVSSVDGEEYCVEHLPKKALGV